MTTVAPQAETNAKPTVICEVDVSAASEEAVQAALSYCSGRGAELRFLWVLEPRRFRSSAPVAVGAVGTWGLPWMLRRAVERAREQGIVGSSVVRIGERERVLTAELEAVGAEAVFSAAHRIVRCPRCHARYDPRAVHFCPKVHLARASRKPSASAC